MHTTSGEKVCMALLFMAAVAFSGGLASWVFLAALDHSPISLPRSARAIRAVVPEGWKFFTRDPREEHLFVWTRPPAGAWQDRGLGPSASPRHFLGLRRTARAQGAEVALLLTQVPAERWHTCEREISHCLRALPSAPSITNPDANPTVCGEIAFVLRKPVPWAWQRQLEGFTMPSRIAKIRVSCSP